MSAASPPRVLAFGAHPDDVEIYCLGTLLCLQQLGWPIGWVVATDGQAGLPPGTPITTRRSEAMAAGNAVGVAPRLLGLQDGRVSDDAGALALVREAIEAFKPDLLLAPSPNDYHPDHRALSRLVHAACPVRAALVEMDTMMGVDFLPGFCIDVSDSFEAKLQCLGAHASQNPQGFGGAIATWNGFRALQTARRDVRYAEAFRIAPAFGRSSALHMLSAVAL
ncbi:MAG TPA: PIG-L family deacetylase [Rubrivivax sp.]|nr:PIG-L family deacetylase [Rubrivivax sp.]